ncbi:MAG: SDR family NAD(P)-dependent oxidoreductase [Cyclonatronaceae bacterium]
MKFAGKTLLISGASRGIGRETALYAAKEGADVIITARTESRLQEVQQQQPARIRYVCADLSKDDGIAAITAFLEEKTITLDALINNAGALVNKPLLETTTEDWYYLLEANLMSAIHLSKTCVPFMKRDSHLLNIGSMGGFQGASKFPGIGGYSVAKGALSILTECLAVELADKKIGANCLCLGAVQTEMLEQAFPGMKAPLQAEEMGRYIAEFAMEAQKFFNGKVLPVSLADPS